MAESFLIASVTALVTGLGTAVVTHLWETKKYKKLIKAEKKKLKEFQAECTYWQEEDYSVLVDGPQSSGKSAIVAKWADPTADITKIGATAGLAKLALFLCRRQYEQDGVKRETWYRLKFFDVPGEQLEIILPIILKEQPRIIMLVIDPTKERESFQRLNPGHIKLLYGNDSVRDMAAGFLVYISKADLVPHETLRRIEQKVNEQIVAPLKHSHPHAFVFSGSALDGRGLHSGLAYMIGQLGLSRYYVRHQSLTD